MVNVGKPDEAQKLEVFISYSREDEVKVDEIYQALSKDGDLRVYLDKHDVEAAVEWQPRLEDFIRDADTIVFVISPSSVSSEICQWEMELASQLNKRIIPVVLKDVADGKIPEAVSRLNYVFCRKKAEFESALKSIRQSIKTDIDWIREHTRISNLAHRWEQSQKLGAQPLRGRELDAAEKWLNDQPKEAPIPTKIQRAYIYESRRAATKRQRL